MSFSTETILCAIHWTRTIVLVLAILIVATSLSIYSTHTIPIFSLFSRYDQAIHTPTSPSQQQQLYHTDGAMTSNLAATRETTILLEMIQDRRLISTLVAAQASVFCPLFLLLTSNNNNNNKQQQISNNNDASQYRRAFALDLICCHVLMPFGLALSWIFCILFDRKTMSALQQQPDGSSGIMAWSSLFQNMCLLDRSTGSAGEWACFGINVVHGLKYLVVLVLFLEIELVIVASLLTRYQRRPIQLENSKADDEWNAAGGGASACACASFMDEQQRDTLLHSNQRQH